MSKVSIILSAYNGERYIKEQIESIMSSVFKDFTLYVFDDCSTDSTFDIVSDMASQYGDRLVLMRNEVNRGSTLSFLNGLKHVNATAPTPYYMFCDQDDVWLMDKIGISLKAICKIEHRRRQGKPVLVFTDAIIVGDDKEYISRSFHKTNHMKVRKHDFAHVLMENKGMGCTMIMNRALVDLVSQTGPDIRYHDWWMSLIASSFGIIRYVRIPTMLYRQHASNQVGQTSFKDYIQRRTGKKAEIRQRLKITYAQAAYFKTVYYDRLSRRKKARLNSFIRLESAGFLRRRWIVIRNRFYKSGLVRNIGLLFYI